MTDRPKTRLRPACNRWQPPGTYWQIEFRTIPDHSGQISPARVLPETATYRQTMAPNAEEKINFLRIDTKRQHTRTLRRLIAHQWELQEGRHVIVDEVEIALRRADVGVPEQLANSL